MFGPVESKVARVGKKAVIGLGAGLCLGVGVAFLTVAAWLLLVAVADALTAATVIGVTYLGAGLILLGVVLTGGNSGTDRTAHNAATGPEQGAAEVPPLMAAFLHGMNAGARTANQNR